MPEPPFQNDMRVQGLPPRTSNWSPTYLAGNVPPVLLVTSLQQIPAALAEGASPNRHSCGTMAASVASNSTRVGRQLRLVARQALSNFAADPMVQRTNAY
jgi:hypothetical protein